MKFLRNEWICLIGRVILGGVFVYASWDKILHPDGFAHAVHNYRVLPDSLISLFALMLPWLELLCGVSLILGLRFQAAATLSGGLLVIFLVAVCITIARGINIECGCFTVSAHGRQAGLSVLIQDAGLLLLTLNALFSGAGKWALASTPSPVASTPAPLG
ncbi:MAG: DoxX family membrane protein [candidate division Zixibacteria bacterium]|nr:DoxX family membrane protein [candidate division Zixibacteria bacterium]